MVVCHYAFSLFTFRFVSFLRYSAVLVTACSSVHLLGIVLLYAWFGLFLRVEFFTPNFLLMCAVFDFLRISSA